MSEMEKLMLDLTRNKIEFDMRICNGEPQIIIRGVGDIICHAESYGGKEGLLEIMGFDIGTLEVLGYLTAEQAFTHIIMGLMLYCVDALPVTKF